VTDSTVAPRRFRASLVVSVVVFAVFLLALTAATGAAQASVGFCEFARLGPGASCESPSWTTVTTVYGEVTSGSAEICVAVHESSGVLLGKKCGVNRAQSQEGVGSSSAKAWIHNNSSTATVTVFGSYLT
jgi:hypothetical protein